MTPSRPRFLAKSWKAIDHRRGRSPGFPGSWQAGSCDQGRGAVAGIGADSCMFSPPSRQGRQDARAVVSRTNGSSWESAARRRGSVDSVGQHTPAAASFDREECRGAQCHSVRAHHVHSNGLASRGVRLGPLRQPGEDPPHPPTAPEDPSLGDLGALGGSKKSGSGRPALRPAPSAPLASLPDHERGEIEEEGEEEQRSDSGDHREVLAQSPRHRT